MRTSAAGEAELRAGRALHVDRLSLRRLIKLVSRAATTRSIDLQSDRFNAKQISQFFAFAAIVALGLALVAVNLGPGVDLPWLGLFGIAAMLAGSLIPVKSRRSKQIVLTLEGLALAALGVTLVTGQGPGSFLLGLGAIAIVALLAWAIIRHRGS